MNEVRIVRHSVSGRILHWLFAFLILTLVATGLLPVLGVDFDWVPVHWISGVLLAAILLLHIILHIRPKEFARIMFEKNDFAKHKSGKYSLEQKLMHNFVAMCALLLIITGLLMMVRIDTPLWERNPYLLQAATWGWVYVIHGLMSLVLVSTIMLHIYFSLRPEKRMYLRSMIKGWISKDEYLDQHDPGRWPED